MAETKTVVVKAKKAVKAKRPRFFRWAVTGAIAGLAATLLALGYQPRVVDAIMASKKAQQEIAGALMDAQRQQIAARQPAEKRGKKAIRRLKTAAGIKTPEAKIQVAMIPVGKRLFTKRDLEGNIIEIGVADIAEGAVKRFEFKPKIPATPEAAGSAKRAAALGAGIGALIGGAAWSGAMYKRRFNEQQCARGTASRTRKTEWERLTGLKQQRARRTARRGR